MEIVKSKAVVDAGWLLNRLGKCRDAFHAESSKEGGDIQSGLDFLAVGIALRKDLPMELLENLGYRQRVEFFKRVSDLCECFEKTFETTLGCELEKSLLLSIKDRKGRQALSYGEVIDTFTGAISRCKGQVTLKKVGYDILFLGYNLPLALIPVLKALSEGEISSDTAFLELCRVECILRRWRRLHFRCI